MQSIRRLGSLVAGLLLVQAAHAQTGTRPATPPAPVAVPSAAAAPAASPATAAAPPTAPPSADADEAAPGAPAPGQAAPGTAPAPAPPGQPPPIAPGAPPGSLDVGAIYSQPVPVWLATEDGETPVVEIYPEWASPGSVPALATCRLPCGFQMLRGRYRIQVQETGDTLSGDRPVSVDGPARLVITPRDRTKRTVGLVLGVGGAIAVIAGIAVIIHGESTQYTAFCDSTTSSCRQSWNTEMTAGGLLALAGAIMTPIGWVMFGKSLRPSIDVEHVAAAVRPVRQVGFIGLPGGGGLGAKFAF